MTREEPTRHLSLVPEGGRTRFFKCWRHSIATIRECSFSRAKTHLFYYTNHAHNASEHSSSLTQRPTSNDGVYSAPTKGADKLSLFSLFHLLKPSQDAPRHQSRTTSRRSHLSTEIKIAQHDKMPPSYCIYSLRTSDERNHGKTIRKHADLFYVGKNASNTAPFALWNSRRSISRSPGTPA